MKIIRIGLLLCAGAAIAWVDTRSGWDDTGVTVMAVVAATAVGALAGIRAPLAAACVAGPLLVAELSEGLGVLMAVPFALIGAYVGGFVRQQRF